MGFPSVGVESLRLLQSLPKISLTCKRALVCVLLQMRLVSPTLVFAEELVSLSLVRHRSSLTPRWAGSVFLYAVGSCAYICQLPQVRQASDDHRIYE